MAIEVHSSPPDDLIAGDTYHWEEIPDEIDSVSSYLIYFRSEKDSSVSWVVTGSDETTSFKFELSGDSTELLDAGEYLITKVITYSWGRESEEAGMLNLLPNPTSSPNKSFNDRMVDLLESHIEGRLPEGLESHTIGGVPISKISLLDAQRLLGDYKSRLEYERNKQYKQRNPEKGSGNTVHLYF